MKKAFILFILLAVKTNCFGQSGVNINNIPQEKIFVHINTTFLVSGEPLYYKIYCINSETSQLSNLSKVAYVELISEDKESLLKHKIRLENGEGYGDFHVPNSLKSGNYKLISYTKLMRNKNRFFENDILIVNPFHDDQSKILDTTSIANRKKNLISETIEKHKSKLLSLEVKADKLKPREKVALEIKALEGSTSFGDYSISVKKKYPVTTAEKLTSTTFENLYVNPKKEADAKRGFFIPEFRGELIKGKVINRKTNTPASNIKIALSIPDEKPIFKIAGTNEEGAFFFNLKERYENTTALIQIIGNPNDDYEILTPEENPIDYNQFDFEKHYINKVDKDIILSKSINNQIENSYSSVKKDSVKDNTVNAPFYGSIGKDYYLDDYKRFPTLKETFVEVIENAWIAKNNDKHQFKIRRNFKSLDFDLPSLLLVDGILVQDHDEILSYDANKINKISVIRDQYIYGPHIFEGIIAVETKNKNFRSTTNGKAIELFKPTSLKKYFSPNYSTNVSSYNRTPDYRDQLLWKPNLKIHKREQTLDFYTSDEKGTYEISLEGFTEKGVPVSIQKLIYVE